MTACSITSKICPTMPFLETKLGYSRWINIVIGKREISLMSNLATYSTVE
jgi:hypothetical protein